MLPVRLPGRSVALEDCAATILSIAVLLGAPGAGAVDARGADPPPSPVEKIRKDAAALRPLVRTGWVRQFLDRTSSLPAIPLRKLFHDEAKTRYYSEAEAAELPEAERGRLVCREVDEDFYYNTRYGTPLAYARPLDLLGRKGFSPAGRRILDFGYGGIGQLRLLAGLGARVVGVEIDPLTRALYSWPGDQGPMAGPDGSPGDLRLVHGRFPPEEPIRQDVGDGYSLIISKNVLKRGFIHPERPVPERQRVVLGVDDSDFIRTLASILEPGGRVLIYNLSPAQNPPDKPYLPWADGRCPFPAPAWEAAGFRIIEFDRDDSVAARRMGRALGWDRGETPMDLERDLFAHYTLVEKPRRP